ELRVPLSGEDQRRDTKADEIVPERGLRSRAEMTQSGGEALHAVLAPALAQLRGDRFRKVSQGRERGMSFPAGDEGVDAFAFRHRRQRLVLEFAAGALVRIGDSRRPA